MENQYAYKIQNRGGKVTLSGNLVLGNATAIWGNLKQKVSPNTTAITLHKINDIDITVLQQLLLIKRDFKQITISARLSDDVCKLLANCNLDIVFDKIEKS